MFFEKDADLLNSRLNIFVVSFEKKKKLMKKMNCP